MKRKTVAILSSVAAVFAAGGLALHFFEKSPYRVDCEGEFTFPVTAKSTESIPDYLDHYVFVNGVPHWDYGGGRGLQANPYQIAYVATLKLQQYCQRKDEEDLRSAISMREWLMDKATVPTNAPDRADLLRVEYEFANLPYAPDPGWGSAFAQAQFLNFAYRVQPRFSLKDKIALHMLTSAMTEDIHSGGLYSNYGNGLIFWEEVAADAPSQIINGHIIVLWGVHELLPRLPLWDINRFELKRLNDAGKELVVQIAEHAQHSETEVLYDLSSQEPNLRNAPHYAWRVMVDGYRWLIEQGYPLEPHLARLERMQLPG